jgi:hypothetical protein
VSISPLPFPTGGFSYSGLFRKSGCKTLGVKNLGDGKTLGDGKPSGMERPWGCPTSRRLCEKWESGLWDGSLLSLAFDLDVVLLRIS